MTGQILTLRKWVQTINDMPSERISSGRPRKGILQPTIIQGWKRRKSSAWDVSMQSVLRVAYLVRDGKCTGIRANTMECLCYALGGYCFYKGPNPKSPIVPMRLLHKVVQHVQPRFQVERDPLVYFQLPIWNMPAWALPRVLGFRSETLRKVRHGKMNVDLICHQKWAWAKHLVLYCTHPLIGTCRVQLPGDGFNEWARSIEARRKEALGWNPIEEV